MKYIDIIKRNRTLSVQMKGRRYRVGIIANVTVAHIKDILELELREEGINAEVIIGPIIVCPITFKNLKTSFLYKVQAPIQLIKPNLLVPILYFVVISTIDSLISLNYEKSV